ncbi:pirin family protein [Thalassotalea sp. G2M2-11]|uniref:pirin family protein n=1 Tax=Thalassotalea sp. G2M2-11 TaxID=2787627 RepID=UPI0019D1D965|nr:pirin family protein [Thalassotalea sp. G2M2-11]
MAQIREVKQVINGLAVSDGDGVQLKRLIGTPYLEMLDPFLMLDAFSSDQPQDYIGGFPEHPHRGFETVTYMLAGKMRHRDNLGNEGVIESGDIQWMSAGKGVIHSEMPEQENGLLAGFQLWVNLPASEKMTPPKYQELKNEQIPVEQHQDGVKIKVIAGQTQQGTTGVIANKFVLPTYWDVQLPQHSCLDEQLSDNHNAFIYLIEGKIAIGEQIESQAVSGEPGQLIVLTNGEHVKVKALQPSRFLLIAGQPLNEAVARGGPFVMNTREQINQAFADYQSGRF